MDDADLEKLIIKPGKLKPKFNRNVTLYEVVLNSGIKQFNLDPLTRDCNASWIITVSLLISCLFLSGFQHYGFTKKWPILL